jgi:hypothetical protein
MRAITFLQTSYQLEVCTQSYGTPKSWKSQFWEFQDSHLGVSRQNDIWVLVSWLGTKYTIRGRWWLPPSPGCGESCESMFTCGSFEHQKCYSYALTNLLFGLCMFAWVIDLLITLPNPILELQHAPLALKCYELRSALTLSPSIVFTFGLAVESIKELGGAWIGGHEKKGKSKGEVYQEQKAFEPNTHIYFLKTIKDYDNHKNSSNVLV